MDNVPISRAFASMLVFRFAKILGQLQNCSEMERKKAEAELLRLYRIKDSGNELYANSKYIRPQIIDALEMLTVIYSNILRYDPDGRSKAKGFICLEADNCFRESVFNANGTICNKTLLYANSAIERAHRELGVAEDDFPRIMDVYESQFYENFLKSPVAMFSTVVLVDITSRDALSVSKYLVNEIKKSGKKIQGISVMNNREMLDELRYGSNLFSKKNIMLVF